MKNKVIQFSSYLLYFLPLTLLTGPFLPDLIISIVGLIFLFLSIRDKEWIYYNNIYTKLFFAFYTYLVLRSLLSVNIPLSLEASLFYFRFGLFSLAVWYLINNNSEFLRIFSKFLLLIFVFCLVDGTYQYFFSENLVGIENDRVRMNLPFSDELILGGYLARMFPLLLALMILNYQFNNRAIYFAAFLLVITDVLIYVTGERSAIFLLTFSTVFIILLISKYKKLRIITFIISLLLIFILTIFDQNIRGRNIDHTIEQMTSSNMSNIQEEGSSYSEIKEDNFIYFSSEHNSYIRTAINMFNDNVIFGQGAKLFRENCKDPKFAFNKSSCSTHPHHTYFQLFGETGLMGLSFFLLFVFIVLFISAKHLFLKFYRNELYLSDYQICLIACFIIFINPFTPSLNFFNNWINILHFLPIGFYLHSIYGNNLK